MKRGCSLLGMIAAAALLATPTAAATFDHFTNEEGHEIVTLSGPIVPGDWNQLVAIERQTNARGVLVTALRLDSPGGNLLEGVQLAKAMYEGKIATVVVRGAACASACFIVFAAGTEKYASYGSRVGVHGASFQNGGETVDAPEGTVAMAKLVKSLGVPPGIIGQMVVTPPDEMVWLSAVDLQSMGVQMTGAGQGDDGSPAPVAAVAPASPVGRADPVVLRKAVAHLIRALTDCVAQRAIQDDDAASELHDGTFNSYARRLVNSCSDQVADLIQVYDRVDGPGRARVFLDGPYSDDLPRAVLKRIQPQLDVKVAALERQLVAKAENEAREKAATDAAQAEQNRKEEADRQAAIAVAEQQASAAKAAAAQAEADAKTVAAKAEAERLQRVEVAKKVEGLLIDKAAECARAQLGSLVKSGESAEVLASAVMTICGSDVDHLLDAGVAEHKLERQLPDSDAGEAVYREQIRADAHEQIVALAVQAKAGVGTFAPAKVEAVP